MKTPSSAVEATWWAPTSQSSLTLPRYSGQFRLRAPRSLHAWLAARAELEGVSLNTLCVQILSEASGQGLLDDQARDHDHILADEEEASWSGRDRG